MFSGKEKIMIAAPPRFVRNILQDLIETTEGFVSSEKPFLKFLEEDRSVMASSPYYLAKLFENYDRINGEFAFTDFLPRQGLGGTEIRHLNSKEASEVVRETLAELANHEHQSSSDDEIIDDMVIDYLRDALHVPDALKEIARIALELQSVFQNPLSKKYPALYALVPELEGEFKVLTDEVITDLSVSAEMTEHSLEQVSEFLKILNRLAKEKLSLVPSPRSGIFL